MKVMRVGISLALVCLLLPAVAPAQKREMTEMNRDVALLQEEVRNMKKAGYLATRDGFSSKCWKKAATAGMKCCTLFAKLCMWELPSPEGPWLLP